MRFATKPKETAQENDARAVDTLEIGSKYAGAGVGEHSEGDDPQQRDRRQEGFREQDPDQRLAYRQHGETRGRGAAQDDAQAERRQFRAARCRRYGAAARCRPSPRSFSVGTRERSRLRTGRFPLGLRTSPRMRTAALISSAPAYARGMEPQAIADDTRGRGVERIGQNQPMTSPQEPHAQGYLCSHARQ